MLDYEIRLAVCKVDCGENTGTGFAVKNDRVVTARHCVIDAIEGDASVILTFPEVDENSITAQLVDSDSELDIAILALESPVACKPVGVVPDRPQEGVPWISFGFPVTKTDVGHRVAGTIETLHATPTARIDADLSIKPELHLADYAGMSGGPVTVGGYVVGVLRLRMGNSLGALMTSNIHEFLATHGIPIGSVSQNETPRSNVAERLEFQTQFEESILRSAGRYLFLEGPHGIGKSTFCLEFRPLGPQIVNVGTYAVRESANSNTVVNSQPTVLFDWLKATISNLLTGRPDRKESKNYSEMATEVAQMLEQVSAFYSAQNQLGMLFIDGLNEVLAIGEERLQLFMGLLPPVLPKNIVIVLSAPNFSAVLPSLAGRVANDDVSSIPPLNTDSCRRFTYANVDDERRSDLKLLNAIVDKAGGHPLYLNYLIRHANQFPDDKHLDDFPIFDGVIEHYYERLWGEFQRDPHVVNLLAIIARLRDGLSSSELFKVLEADEQTAYIPTFARIQHLFLDADHTSIYHDSFRTFTIQQTLATQDRICERLAEFCMDNDEIPYCTLHRIHHLLQSNAEHRIIGIERCTQAWVDECVHLSVQPDVLLEDLNGALSFALESGSSAQSVRILFLMQRAKFRYNFLFASSATLVAKALIGLGRPDDALEHVVRYGHLIVTIGESLQIAWDLIEAEHIDAAEELLGLCTDACIEYYSTDRLEISEFVDAAVLHILGLLFLRCTGRDQLPYVVYAQKTNIRIVEESIKDDSAELREFAIGRILGVPNLYFLSFHSTYTTNSQLQSAAGGNYPCERLLHMRLDQLVDHLDYVEKFQLEKATGCYAELLSDIKAGFKVGEDLERDDLRFVIDALIRIGADIDCVDAIARGNEIEPPRKANLRDENGVDANIAHAHTTSVLWRAAAFIDESVELLNIVSPTREGWQRIYEQLFEGVGILDGKSRRALVSGEAEELKRYCDYLFDSLLPVLESPLSERIFWERSYAIPEDSLPFLMELIAELVVDCFNDKLEEFLKWLSLRAADQLGVYSEGYRNAIHVAVEYVSRYEVSSAVQQQLLELLRGVRKHAFSGVENRQELVPELLRQVTAFSRIGATEEAEETHAAVLQFSMGPTWYKEEQFGVLTTALRTLPDGEDVAVHLPRIAALLECASGEMTFQRSVRYDKAELIGLLASRHREDLALAFFKHQSCGTGEQLFIELEGSPVDRASPAHGSRHPGGAIDEQDAILWFVGQSRLGWQLRWALLEIFQFGDYRHITNFAAGYATILNEHAEDGDVLETLTRRFHLLVMSEVAEEQRYEFLSAFQSELAESNLRHFIAIIAETPKPPEGFGFGKAKDSFKKDPEQDTPMRTTEREDLFFPGLFGRTESLDEAKTILAEAKNELALGNVQSSQRLAAEALEKIQEGEWSIWDGSESTHSEAESLLRSTCDSGSELLPHYRTLALRERNAPTWRIADHLIKKLDGILDTDEAQSILAAAMEHIELIVGSTKGHVEGFESLFGKMRSDADEAAIGFINWLVGHPTWLRREKAAELLVWLSSVWGDFLPKMLHLLSEDNGGFGADVLFGILSSESRRHPLRVWQQLETEAVVEQQLLESQHAYRLSILHAILCRAADSGSNSAKSVLERLEGRFRTGDIVVPSFAPAILPSWAGCISRQWAALNELGLASRSVLDDCKKHLEESFGPRSIYDGLELEAAVSKSFGEPADGPWNRWSNRVLHALNCSLAAHVAVDQIPRLAELLTPVNPNIPCAVRSPTYRANFSSKLEAIGEDNLLQLIAIDDDFVLHSIEMGQEGAQNADARPRSRQLEIVAVLVAEALNKRGYFVPEITAYFSSRQHPAESGEEHETCSVVLPTSVFCGAFTPAEPLPAFLQNVSASQADCQRQTWRQGRSLHHRSYGLPSSEGALLSIKKSAVSLPKDKKLAWIISLDGRTIGMIDDEGTELY